MQQQPLNRQYLWLTLLACGILLAGILLLSYGIKLGGQKKLLGKLQRKLHTETIVVQKVRQQKNALEKLPGCSRSIDSNLALQTLTHATNKYNLQLISLVPADKKSGWKIKLSGHYVGLVKFMNGLARSKYCFIVAAMSIQKSKMVNSDSNLEIGLNLMTGANFLKWLGKNGRRKLVRVDNWLTYKYKMHDPFAAAILIPFDAQNELRKFSVDNLQQLGTIIQGSKRWSIVKAPNGRAYHCR